ncbi:hypothetical protein WICPIJ_009027 [Wickerhamomyces pijperi]|uniref:Uncharacterized protein n=1 Tax=Wickerhamomyces pijperi TaxID=599730 RepID=A0A9P8PRN2_WICPI|nr:hypothetical protein WICPIJ_009027 [Wickerhamomyces pijperi]
MKFNSRQDSNILSSNTEERYLGIFNSSRTPKLDDVSSTTVTVPQTLYISNIMVPEDQVYWTCWAPEKVTFHVKPN